MADLANFRTWRRALDLAEAVYRVTADMPRSELLGLTSQLRRAAVSIPANLAEGAGRCSRRDFARFVVIASGSASELESHLLLAGRLGYIDRHTLDHLRRDLQIVGRMLTRLRLSLRAPRHGAH